MKRTALALLFFLWVPATSMAFFAHEEAPVEPKPAFNLTGIDNLLTQVGHGNPQPVGSFGQQIPLASSLEMLIPAGWTCAVGEELNKENLKVSWDNQGTWIDALGQVSEQEELRTLVDWDNQKVFVVRSEQEMPLEYAQLLAQQREKIVIQPITVQPNETSSIDSSASGVELSKEVSPAPEVDKRKIWQLEPGGLKEQIESWAASEGYRVRWTSKYDYPIEAETELKGELFEVVTALFDSLYRQGKNVHVAFYNNKYIVVSEGAK